MIETTCSCGGAIRAAETAAGKAVRCGNCGHIVRIAAAERVTPETALGDFDARLTFIAGPDSIGDCIVLGGVPDIDIGKGEGRHILLPATSVSRAHAKLVRLDFGPSRWKLMDMQSRNGVFINGHQIFDAELREGDLVQIGEYKLRYNVGYTEAQPVLEEADFSQAPPVLCKSCGTTYPGNTIICTACGINIRTGRPLVTSKEMDRDDVDQRIRIASYAIPLCIAPIASEGFGTRKPIAMWVIFGITIFVSVLWYVGAIANEQAVKNAMLWVGSNDARHAELTALVQHKFDEDDPDHQSASPKPQSQFEYDPREHAVQQTVAAVESDLTNQESEFQWYQLLTHALLHAGWSHLAGNMLFLLVFGLPVNEVLGNVKTAIVYPLLAIGAGGIDALIERNQPLHPCLGASGAIMGLAGMYFVLFPIQRMHMAIWLRLWFPFLFRTYTIFFGYKTWRMRGFWLLLLLVGFNDILPTVIGSKTDHVAHWAHLGGFVTGVFIALVMLLTRQVHAHGGDILSVVIGPRVWNVIGKPQDRTTPATIA